MIAPDNAILDHQSRVIETNSWDEYVDAFLNYDGKSVEFKSLTSMIGNSINRELELHNFKYDDFHLSCNFSSKTFETKWLAYLVK